MAQNITLLGANYSSVPSVLLPKTGGGTAAFTDVSDTTAAASDVTSGKWFYTAAGAYTQGTNSGGGGASNFVTGTFTTLSTTDAHGTVNISYTGSGYPLMIVVVIENGAYNNTASGDTNWYNSVQKYVVGQWTCTKSIFTSAPTYSTSGAENQGVTTTLFKNSTTSATTYSRTSGMNSNVFSSSNGSNTAGTCVRYKSGNVLSYYVASNSYGLLKSTTYRYFIAYSS